MYSVSVVQYEGDNGTCKTFKTHAHALAYVKWTRNQGVLSVFIWEA